MANTNITPAMGALSLAGGTPTPSLGFPITVATGVLAISGQPIAYPFTLQHARTIVRASRFPLLHNREIITDAAQWSLLHSRTVLRIYGAGLQHTRVVLPAAIFTLFDDDTQEVTGVVEKS